MKSHTLSLACAAFVRIPEFSHDESDIGRAYAFGQLIGYLTFLSRESRAGVDAHDVIKLPSIAG